MRDPVVLSRLLPSVTDMPPGGGGRGRRVSWLLCVACTDGVWHLESHSRPRCSCPCPCPPPPPLGKSGHNDNRCDIGFSGRQCDVTIDEAIARSQMQEMVLGRLRTAMPKLVSARVCTAEENSSCTTSGSVLYPFGSSGSRGGACGYEVFTPSTPGAVSRLLRGRG